MILRYTVFDKILDSETVIQVNFAQYSVIRPRDGDKIPNFMKNVNGTTVIYDITNGITVISNIVRPSAMCIFSTHNLLLIESQ